MIYRVYLKVVLIQLAFCGDKTSNLCTVKPRCMNPHICYKSDEIGSRLLGCNMANFYQQALKPLGYYTWVFTITKFTLRSG